MILKTEFKKTVWITLLLFASLFTTGQGVAELRLDSVLPSQGVVGQDLEVTLTGTGFDANTRVSMSLDVGNNKATIGTLETLESAIDITVIGNTAYVADGNSGLQIINVSTPSNPFIIKTVDTPGFARCVAVLGDVAYVADGDSGLQIIDVSNPSAASIIVGFKDTIGSAQYVTVSGNTAYIIDGYDIDVIDVSNPSEPSIIMTFTPEMTSNGSLSSVKVVGDTAYVLGKDYEEGRYDIYYWGSLRVFDVSNPLEPPIFKSSHSISGGWPSDLTIVGDKVYVADLFKGLLVIDMSNILEPSTIGSVDTQGDASDVTVIGDIAYVAYEDGLQVIDVTSPSDPSIIGFVNVSANSVSVNGSMAYVVGSRNMQVIDVSNLSASSGTVNIPGSARDLTLIGNTAYVVYEAFNSVYDSSSLQLIDVSSSTEPSIIGSVDIPEYATNAAIIGDVAYITTTDYGVDYGDEYYCESSWLKMVDISSPTTPSIIESWNVFEGIAEDMTVVGNIAYVTISQWMCEAPSELKLVDLSSPSEPSIIGSVVIPGSAKGVTVIGDTAYVANSYSGLQIIDVSNPSVPFIIGSVDTPGNAYNVTVIENTAYVADSYNGLQIINVSTPSAPFIIGSVDTPGNAYDVTVNADTDTAYVANGDEGLYVINVSNPLKPIIIGTVDTPGRAKDVTVIENTAYIADGSEGFIIVPLPVEIKPVNFNSLTTNITVTLPGPQVKGHYTLRVFNETESYELPGAVTFLEEGDPRLTAKAIILAGKGSETDERWQDIMYVADIAYERLRERGFTNDRIRYLTSETKSEFVNTIISPTEENLSNALLWAEYASGLVLYFVGHGGDGNFRINPDTTIQADSLSDQVSILQKNMTGKVIFIYEACKSGSFIPLLSANDSNRIIIVSGASEESSWLLKGGETSFSDEFWYRIKRKSLSAAFKDARDKMMDHMQNARLDTDNDGFFNEPEDITIGAHIYIGRGTDGIEDTDISVIKEVSDPITLNGNTEATIWAGNLSLSDDKIQSVKAVIFPPDGTEPIQIELSLDTNQDSDNYGRYTGYYQDFSKQGTYIINIFVNNANILCVSCLESYDFKYESKTTTVTQTNGNITSAPDLYEEDGTFNEAKVIFIDDPEPQYHNFHKSGDNDWIRFYAISAQSYTVKVTDLSSICNAVIQLYDTDGINPLTEPTLKSAGSDDQINWTCRKDGIYYVRVQNYEPEIFGETIRYSIEVHQPKLPEHGTIQGIVKSSGNPVGGVKITTTGKGHALSAEDGRYSMTSSPGPLNLEARAEGYVLYSAEINLEEGATLPYDISLVPLKLPTPEFSPIPDTYPSSQSVTISCTTTDATIRYTTDGNEPAESSTAYTTPINVSATTTIKAKAFKTGHTPSDTATGLYTITGKAATPQFSPVPATYTTPQSVTITCSTPGAAIRYTTNGSEPVETSEAYSEPIPVNSGMTINAKAFKTDWEPSDMAAGTYSITGTVAVPTFSPDPGTYTTEQRITLSCLTSDAVIHYTTNGNEPSENSPVYTSPILIATDTTIKAKAFKTGWTSSQTSSGVYYIRPVLKGDIDGVNGVNLTDAIIALQVVAGMNNSTQIRDNYAGSGADVNSNDNDKIGLEEVIYILKNISE